MSFPLSISGSFTIARSATEPATPATVAAHAQAALAARSDDVRLDGQSVTAPSRYKGWFATPYLDTHPLAPFEVVRLEITDTPDGIGVTYDLGTRKILLYGLLIGLFFACQMGWFAYTPDDPAFAARIAMIYGLFGFVGIFGLNYVIGLIRAPAWLKRELGQ